MTDDIEELKKRIELLEAREQIMHRHLDDLGAPKYADPVDGTRELNINGRITVWKSKIGFGSYQGFVITGWGVFPSIDACAFVCAREREEAKRTLKAELAKQRVFNAGGNPDNWTVEPVTPLIFEPVAKIILGRN